MFSMGEYILQRQANNPFYSYTPDPEKLKTINKSLDLLPIKHLLEEEPLDRVEFNKRFFNK